MPFDPTQPFEAVEETPAEKPAFDPSKPFNAQAEKPAEKPAFDPAQPFEAVAPTDFSAPDFHPAAHAISNPEEKEAAYQAWLARENRSAGEKTAAFAGEFAKGENYENAGIGASKFALGLVGAPLHTIAQDALTVAHKGMQIVPDAVLKAVGAGNLDNKIQNELQTQGAEALLAGQHIEENLKALYGGANHMLEDGQAWAGRQVMNLTGQKPGEDDARGADFNSRARFDDEIEALKKQQALHSMTPLNTGFLAGASRLATGNEPTDAFSPQALEIQGARPANSLFVDSAAASADPVNLALPYAAKIPGVSTATGAVLQATGKALKFPLAALKYVPKVAKIGKVMTGAAGGVAVLEAAMHPQASFYAAATLALGKFLDFGGEALDSQGRAIRTGIPSALDITAQNAASAGESAVLNNTQRLIGNTAGHAVATGIGFAPANYVMAGGDPEKSAQGEISGAVMGAMFALPGETFANRSQMAGVARYRMANDGAQRFSENPAYDAHDAQMGQISAPYRDAINRMRSFLFRSTGTEVLFVDGATFAQRVGAADGGAINGRGTFIKEGKTIYINADAVAQGFASHDAQAAKGIDTAGHEAGHALVKYLQDAGRSADADGLFKAITGGITDADMKAMRQGYRKMMVGSTPGAADLIPRIAAIEEFLTTTYDKTAKALEATTGKPPTADEINAEMKKAQAVKDAFAEHAKLSAEKQSLTDSSSPQILTEENLSEITRKILDGEDISNFLLPKPVLEKLADITSRWMERTGRSPKVDPNAPLLFKAKMVKEAARQMRAILYDAGKRANAGMGKADAQARIDLRAQIEALPAVDPSMGAREAAENKSRRKELEDRLREITPDPQQKTVDERAAELEAIIAQAPTGSSTLAELDAHRAAVRELAALRGRDPGARRTRTPKEGAQLRRDTRVELAKNGVRGAEANDLMARADAAHGSPITDPVKLAQAALRLKNGGAIIQGEFAPGYVKPVVPIADPSGLTFTDPSRQPRTVTGISSEPVAIGDIVVGRDSKPRRVAKLNADGSIDVVFTTAPPNSMGFPLNAGEFVKVDHTGPEAPQADPAAIPVIPANGQQTPQTPVSGIPAVPAAAPAGNGVVAQTPVAPAEAGIAPAPEAVSPAVAVATPPEPEAPAFTAVQRGTHWVVLDASGEQAGKSVFWTEASAKQSIARKGKGAFNLIPNNTGSPDVIDAILAEGGINLGTLSKEEQEAFIKDPHLRRLLGTDNPDNTPDEIARLIARREGRGEGDDDTGSHGDGTVTDLPQMIADAYEARRSGRKQVNEHDRDEHQAERVGAQQFEAEVTRVRQMAADAALLAASGEKNTKTQAAKDRVRAAQIEALAEANPDGIRIIDNPGAKSKTIELDYDPGNPAHVVLAEIAGKLTPEAEQHLMAMQGARDEVVHVVYHSAENGLIEGSLEDIFDGMGNQRTPTTPERQAQYDAQTAQDRAEGKVKGRHQQKAVIPLGTEISATGGIRARFFTLDNLFHNARRIIDFLGANFLPDITNPYEGPEGDILESDMVRDANAYARNSANGWTGDGKAKINKAKIKQFPDSGLPHPTPGFVPEIIDAERFNFLNLLFHSPEAGTVGKRTAEIADRVEALKGVTAPAEKTRLEGVLARARARLHASKEYGALARHNDRWVNETTGEVNPMREALEKEGFDFGRHFKSPFETLLPENIVEVSKNPIEGAEPAVRDTGMSTDPAELGRSGRPADKAVRANMLPDSAESAGATAKTRERAAKLWKEQGTGSPFFKKWFGDSKVTDGSGAPKILYTGQPRGMEVIPQTTRSELPLGLAFFSTSREVAGKYSGAGERDGSTDFSTGRKGRTYRVFAKIENPIDLDEPLDLEQWESALAPQDEVQSTAENNISYLSDTKLNKLAERYGIDINDEDGDRRATSSIAKDITEKVMENPESGILKKARREVLASALGLEESWDEPYNDEPARKVGYVLRDGFSDDTFSNDFDFQEVMEAKWKAIVGQGYNLQDALSESPTGQAFALFPEIGEKIAEDGGHDGYVHTDTENGGKTWIPFHPEQIKSATGNSGEFDPKNKDIRMLPDSAEPQSAKEKAQERQRARAVPQDKERPEFDNASARTQIATTARTYTKAAEQIPEGAKVLDYGAGLGLGTDALTGAGHAADSYEPFPERWKGKTPPTFTDSARIADNSYDHVVNFSVLNVVKPAVRDFIVRDIGRILKQGGTALITARTTADVGAATNKTPDTEPGGFIVGDRYQKGFSQQELTTYLQKTLGDGFTVEPNKNLNGASVRITKTRNTKKQAAERLRKAAETP